MMVIIKFVNLFLLRHAGQTDGECSKKTFLSYSACGINVLKQGIINIE